MSENFLSRWSRRKGEARQEKLRDETVAPERSNIATPPPEPPLAPEEIAALPKVEEITAESDITGFLRRGVPDALRNAALRRMWMLDPAIRDFAGHARDYDFDWNTPGGAPGHGALGQGDEVAAMLRRVLGEPDVPPTRDASEKNAIGADDKAETGSPASPMQRPAQRHR